MKRYLSPFLLLLLAACTVGAALPPNSRPTPRPTKTSKVLETSEVSPAPEAYTLFSINVQDFSYPAESAAVLEKIIGLHEETGVPVDIYLTDEMAHIYAEDYPDLLERLKTSPAVAVSYHARPPRPYASANDWLGLKDMPADELYDTILRYETHAVDPVSGQTTDAPGGYQSVADLIGYPPYAASALSGDPDISAATLQVFTNLGAQITVSHGKSLTLGETKGGLPVRPEQVDYKLFEHVGEDAGAAFEQALAQAQAAGNGDAPVFVGVKMHDNDFFAEQSAWVTIYVQDRKRPDWDPTLKAAPLSQEEQDAVWALYEATVRYVVAQGARLTPLNIPLVLEMLE